MFPHLCGFCRWKVQPGGECDRGGTESEEQSGAAGEGTQAASGTSSRCMRITRLNLQIYEDELLDDILKCSYATFPPSA